MYLVCALRLPLVLVASPDSEAQLLNASNYNRTHRERGMETERQFI